MRLGVSVSVCMPLCWCRVAISQCFVADSRCIDAHPLPVAKKSEKGFGSVGSCEHVSANDVTKTCVCVCVCVCVCRAYLRVSVCMRMFISDVKTYT